MNIKNHSNAYIVILSTLLVLSLCLHLFSVPQSVSFKDKVAQINQRLTYTEISPSSFLSISNQGIHEQYEISLRKEFLTNTYLFSKYQYIIEGVEFSEVCAIVDSLRNNQREKIKHIIERIKISAAFSAFSFFKIQSELQVIIAEIYYAIASLGKGYPVDIYIKGFADGYKEDWKRPLNERKRYKYTTIDYLPTLDIHSFNPIHYSDKAEKYTIVNDSFSNKDLPNLRAAFIKEDVIRPAIEQCSNNIRNIHLLEGYEFSKDSINKMERKVQIFIRYLKE